MSIKMKFRLTSEFVVQGVHEVLLLVPLGRSEVCEDPHEVVEVDDVVAALRLDHHPTLVLQQLNHVPIRDPNSYEQKLDCWLKYYLLSGRILDK